MAKDSGTIFSRLLKNYSTCHSEAGVARGICFSWLLEGSRFSAQKPRVEEEILAEFTPALPGLGMTINTAFFSNRLENHDEQRGIMTRVETIGVVDGGDDARGLNRVVRAAAPPAISTLSLRAEGATFEGRA